MNKVYFPNKTKSDIAALLKRVRALVEGMTAATTPEVPDHIVKMATAQLGPQDARYAPAALGDAAGGVDIEAVKAAMQSLDPQDDRRAKAALDAAKASGDLDRPRRVFYI